MAKIIKGKNSRKPYTVRYWVDGRQKEKSFTKLGSPKEQGTAKHFAATCEQETIPSSQRLAHATLSQVLDELLQSYTGRTRETKSRYGQTLIKHYGADRSIRRCAEERDAHELFNVKMIGYSPVTRRLTRTVLIQALELAGIPHSLRSQTLVQPTITETDYREPVKTVTAAEYQAIQETIGLQARLQRRLGLRACEALGLEKSDFRDDCTTLRLQWQMVPEGTERVPLKMRQAGQYRDIPVPASLAAEIRKLPDGPLIPGITTRYKPYKLQQQKLRLHGLPGSHSLRHTYATELLDKGVKPSVVARLLGHSSAAVTLKIYYHVMPDDMDGVRGMLGD